MPESADPSKAKQGSSRRPPPEVEKRWRSKLGDEEFEIRVRRIQGAKPLFADQEAADTSSGEVSPLDDESPPPRKPPDHGGSDGDTPDPSPRKRRKSVPILVSLAASALSVLAIILLSGAMADLVGDPSLTIAERTSGSVAVLSALIGVIATCVSAALLTLGAFSGGVATRAVTTVLGAGLLLLGVSGGVSIAASFDDTCDSQCAVGNTVPTPAEAPTPGPTSEPET